MKFSKSLLLCFAVLSLFCCTLNAQQIVATNTNVVVPPLVNFSGVLTDVNGKPLTGIVGVTFYLYQEQQDGSPLWMETQNVEPDATGHYSVMLGATSSSGLPANIFAAGKAHWLSVQPEGQAEQPRVLLLSVPYALKAGDAQTVGGLPASAFLKASGNGSASASNSSQAPAAITGSGTVNHITKWLSATELGASNIFDKAGKVGIATTSPGATLDVNGSAIVRDNATVNGSLGTGPITATSSSSGGTGVFANAGSSTASNGVIAYGATGVAGYATVNGSIGVYGNAGSSTASNGVWGYGATGVAGYSSITGSYGTYGNGSTGVWGQGSSSYGVLGTVGSSGVDGVHGETASENSGVAGLNSNSTSGYGVFGQAASPKGIGGGFYNTSTGDALFTLSFGGGYAAFLDGNVEVDGNLSKAGGSFKIDDPIDPANKYLYHSFVESPDMMNIYNGNVTTDAEGNAVVQLPHWFETLNRDFRYQLTVLGQFSQAIIASKVANHQFAIKTDKPKVEVSWQVTGIRQDAWANAHRIPVEVPKAEADRGLYLHPELFGAPAEKSIALAHHPTMLKLHKQAAALTTTIKP